jgi:hypothetical protein
MNLYKLYAKPNQLIGYKQAKDVVPELIWSSVTLGDPLSEKQLAVLASDAEYALRYAHRISGRFPQGEPAILKNPMVAVKYAYQVIYGRWPMGEAAIAKDAWSSFNYAKEVLLDRFPAGEHFLHSDPPWFRRDYLPLIKSFGNKIKG